MLQDRLKCGNNCSWWYKCLEDAPNVIKAKSVTWMAYPNSYYKNDLVGLIIQQLTIRRGREGLRCARKDHLQ